MTGLWPVCDGAVPWTCPAIRAREVKGDSSGAASNAAVPKRRRGARSILKVEKSFVINAPLEEVFAFASDPFHIADYSVALMT